MTISPWVGSLFSSRLWRLCNQIQVLFHWLLSRITDECWRQLRQIMMQWYWMYLKTIVVALFMSLVHLKSGKFSRKIVDEIFFVFFFFFPNFHRFDPWNSIRFFNNCTSELLFTCCNDCPLADLRRDEVNLRAIIFTLLRARSLVKLLIQSLLCTRRRVRSEHFFDDSCRGEKGRYEKELKLQEILCNYEKSEWA